MIRRTLALSVVGVALTLWAQPAKNDPHDPANAVANLEVHKEVQATLFAHEPMLVNPTNLDVDHRGRVWVCEVINYRGNNGKRPDGDRILIFEDRDGDGKAEEPKVFYQGRDIDSAMGICVLGKKVIVSCSPNVFVFTDEDGDDRPDKKELLFTKTGQPQHDHSAHSFLFGPDGKLYWNFGNTGQGVRDKDGKQVIDLAGNAVVDNGKPYFGGMPFRCNLDGSEFEVLGHNFRNNYEVTVDSFGTLWQSDNDDDGNRGVRINYVMEYGNYGYREELTGAGWQKPRTNMEAEIPLRHWHLNDPGVVPNLLQTGQGSPTGICLYEGELLPKVFRNQVIHCDAGPSVTRAYPVTSDGAGYKAETVNILDGRKNNFFRPADVCTAPDGSLFVTDWYDPGVGGHAQRDLGRGRIFRVAPPGHKYSTPKFDFDTAAGAVEAMKNPNLAARYLAWTALHEMQEKAEPELTKLWKSDNPRYRARALWLLGKIKGRGEKYVHAAVGDEDSDIRIVGLRLARQLKLDVIPLVKKLVRDPSPQVRRECAITLRHNKASDAAGLWAELANQHDGKDRWYLEALGIAADKQWDAFLDAWLKSAGEKWDGAAGRDIVWRSRAAKTSEYLAKIISDSKTSAKELPRYFRAFDFQPAEARDRVMPKLAFGEHAGDAARAEVIVAESLARLGNVDLKANPEYAATVDKLLERTRGTAQFVDLVGKFNVTGRYPDLLTMAQKDPEGQSGVNAVRVLLEKKQTALLAKGLEDREHAVATSAALGSAADDRAVELLMPVVQDDKRPVELRRQATRSLAKARNGATALIRLARANRLAPELKDAAGFSLSVATWPDVKKDAAELFPSPPGKDRPLPPLGDLLKMKGDVSRGRTVFATTGTCANCHVVNGAGKEVGPELSEIGKKLSREALFESVLYPNAGISHGFEAYTLETSKGNVLQGLLVSATPDEVTLKGPDALVRTFKRSEVESLTKSPVSLMPADLNKLLTAQDLTDVVEFMQTLKQAQKPKK